MKNLLILHIGLCLVFCQSETKAQKKIKYDGYIELGAEAVYKELYVESFVRSKLEVKVELNKKTEIEIDIRAYSDKEKIEVKEASVEYKFSDVFKLKFGQLKKDFGKEESVSREKLNTVNRSLVNAYLSPLGYVSRDPGISLIWETDNYELTTGIFYNNSHDITLMSRYIENDFMGFANIGGSLRYIKHINREGLNYSYAAGLEFIKEFGECENEFELYYGIDPLKTGFNNMTGNENNINFFAAKLLTTYKFKLDNVILTAVEPLLGTTVVVPETNDFGVNKYQLLLGINFYIDAHIRFMINGDLILSNNKINKDKRSMIGSNVIAQFQVRW